ncbi:MAG: iron ABC transporter substrate-binding protein [Chloroflexota bacterium]|nr:iron ABC transporter substrate-binding protein [Chloroflexota bacterium]
MPLAKIRTGRYRAIALALFGIFAIAGAACSGEEPAQPASTPTNELTIYSGRGESLVGPLIERFEELSGIAVRVRYAGTAELAAAILEEGDRSRADVFYSQDAGALAALAEGGVLSQLPQDVVESVPEELVDASARWVGTSGRARALVVSTDRVPDPPDSIFDLVDEEWRGRVGWAPTNASFQAFITAMRQIHGEDATEEWLRGMLANDVVEYPKNSPIVQAVGDGEIDIGLVNHYYLHRFIADNPDFPAFNHFTDAGAAGGLVNVAGVAVLDASENSENALRFVRFLLSEEGQTYFRDQTTEYPLASGVDVRSDLVPLADLDPPSLALTSLSDLEGTLELLRDVGALP